jgi:hypothetical protein
MEKKQTAVEWLEWQINLGLSERGLISAFKEAKQMHKEEIIKVVMDFGWSKEKADKYYNETYGGDRDV